jgi:hypothetical protein
MPTVVDKMPVTLFARLTCSLVWGDVCHFVLLIPLGRCGSDSMRPVNEIKCLSLYVSGVVGKMPVTLVAPLTCGLACSEIKCLSLCISGVEAMGICGWRCQLDVTSTAPRGADPVLGSYPESGCPP